MTASKRRRARRKGCNRAMPGCPSDADQIIECLTNNKTPDWGIFDPPDSMPVCAATRGALESVHRVLMLFADNRVNLNLKVIIEGDLYQLNADHFGRALAAIDLSESEGRVLLVSFFAMTGCLDPSRREKRG